MKVFSFGGGVQSMAVMVLSATGKLDYTHFVFSNVGDDTENPQTLRYVEEVAKPYAETYGLTIVEVTRNRKPEQTKTLYQHVMQNDRNIPIPMYISGKPAKRICTSDWKINVLEKWARANGATRDARMHMGVGISVDESYRMRTDDPDRNKYTQIFYPLIDLHMSRTDCHNIIRAAGLPVAPKSSCWFCPFKKPIEWSEMREAQPELFQKAVELEKFVQSKKPNYASVYLTGSGMPLEQAIPFQSAPLWDDDDWANCESGHCMT